MKAKTEPMTVRLFTTVEVPALPFNIGLEEGVAALGSCFADAIGVRLEEGGFRVERNPFGTLYNPASLASALERIMECREVGPGDLVQHEGLWHSWHHHGSFSQPTAEATLEVCNRRIRQAHKALREARLLLLTFGTAYVYRLASPSHPAPHAGVGDATPQVVANCHKLPSALFERRCMSVEEIAAIWHPLLERLVAFNPQIITLFTVSPIRHMADGAHGNQLSKATLLLAVENLVSPSPAGTAGSGARFYFPAYEIVMDELRDYRFYGPDLAHPTALAEDIVYDRFQHAVMSPATLQQSHFNAKRAKQLKHRPLH